MKFTTDYQQIIAQLDQVDPVAYGKTRNFVDGAVTRLSPYISRGVISTKMVMNHVLSLGHEPSKIEKFLQELAWRDYWQQIWIAKGDAINEDLKHPQSNVDNEQLSVNLQKGATRIDAIDQSIQELYRHGYLHNHVRMYIAAIACNMAKSHWKIPAQWMYYHLIDGDWASNALSWQWVSGANSNKKYVANQENINRYCHTDQKGTFLDCPYADFEHMSIPALLQDTDLPDLKTP